VHETAKPLVVLSDQTPEAAMSLPRTVAYVIDSHVTLELESVDGVYLDVYQPKLQTPRAAFHFLRDHYGERSVTSHKTKVITEQFLRSIDNFAREHHVPVISFEQGPRKEDLRPKRWRPKRWQPPN
jgi:hypothetical protein